MDRNFDKGAEIYFRRRLDEHYNKRAILIKAALTGMTFGIIPHILAWGRSSTLVEVESSISQLLYGETALTGADIATSHCRVAPSKAMAVLRGLELISWYKMGVFLNDRERLRHPGEEGNLPQGDYLTVEVESSELGEDDVNILMILDRKGKAPLFRTLFQ